MEHEKIIQKLKDERPHQEHFDCLSCSNSMSDDNNILHCVVHEKIVEEYEFCKHYN
jgi:hypothetical protein